MHMEVKVLFFGVLSEVTGTYFKHYHDVHSVDHLRMRIIDDFPEFAHYNYRVAVNNDITEDDLPLKHDDEVAFLPPFAGG